MEDIFYDDRGKTHRVTQSWIDSRTAFNHNWFKVIGEISSEATWVTEGMEFNESEVMEVYSREIGRVEYQIKCPTCGRFH
jgi:hypothetical protein